MSVTIGTPLSPSAKKVLLCGAGELGKEVAIELQRLGVETVAVDRYENAPGQQVAHHARTITMSDPAQLKALIEKERPHLVVPDRNTWGDGHAKPSVFDGVRRGWAWMPRRWTQVTADTGVGDPREATAEKGAAFAMEPKLFQSAWFRPHNRSEEVEGLYLVGAGTHPGAGLPGVVSSAKILDKIVPPPR